MTLRFRTVAAVAAVAAVGFAPTARAADVPTHTIDPHEFDAGIDAARGKNLVYLAPATKRVGKLLVFLPLGGANNLPTEFEEIGSEAGRLGYHTIVLAYKNEVPIANATACGNEVDPLPTAPPNCAINARMEILNGENTSPVITVNRANSIENRLNKMLAYLVATYPDEGWAQFVEANGEPKWSETVIAGGSLGAGEAALIASLHSVPRVSMFTGWTDAKHGWVAIGATPADRYFAMVHAQDHFYERTCTAYAIFGMPETCPLTNPADLVENRQPPFGTRELVYNVERDLTAPDIADPYHPSTTRDPYIAKEADGVTPSHILINAWRSTLGDSDADTYLDQKDNCPQAANPAQTDADMDGTGDSCDPTPRGTVPPTITVPASIVVDATGPAGAPVPYTATATDDLDPNPPVTCTPSAGSVFAIGATTVNCSATDAGANTANASFLVTVRGAPEQLGRLVTKVGGTPALASLIASLDPNRPLQRLVACVALRAFVILVPHVAPAHATEWLADANRIRAVLAC